MANPEDDVDKKESEDNANKRILKELKELKDDEYDFPYDSEEWTVDDLGEAWITEKISEDDSSEDNDTSSYDSSGDDVSIHFSIEDELGSTSEDEKFLYEDVSSDDEASSHYYRALAYDIPDVGPDYQKKDFNEGFGWDPDLAGRFSKKMKRMRILSDEEEGEEEEDDDEEFYVPYHRTVPAIPENYFEIRDEEDVVEELDRIEEALKWHSVVFDDGCTYEGTIWDDCAQGKGVFVTPLEICRYEGEWHQNMMQGHGVLEVDIPDVEPAPDSELAEKMRERGKILKSDYMSPEDREWLIMDINDKKLKKPRRHQVYDNPEWIEYFGEMPERGHYRYAGQWKHGRMHGCGVYEVNRRLVWGKFYFGELESDSSECTADISAMHASLAEVAAAKARMFVNKPDGMVRELKGPYTDPQHPYMYEEEDMWMAPGFINQFYEVPELWQRYVHDVDQEREMWLNSYYKSPLRIPMPSELEHWWSKDPEFLIVPDLNDPQKEILLHVPSEWFINWSEDPEGHVRLFWEPFEKDKPEDEPDDMIIPLEFDEFMGENEEEKARIAEEKHKMDLAEKEQAKRDAMNKNFVTKKNNAEENRKCADFVLQHLKSEESTEGILDDVEYQINMKYMHEETSELKVQEKEPKDTPGPEDSEGGPSQDYEEEEEEDDGDEKRRSFGTVAFAESQCYQRSSDEETDTNGRSSSQTPTLFASLSMVSKVAVQLEPIVSWLKGNQCMHSMVGSPSLGGPGNADRKMHNAFSVVSTDYVKSINYSPSRNQVVRLKAGKSDPKLGCRYAKSPLHCTELHFPFQLLSQSRYPSYKPNKSYGNKRCQEIKKREQKQSRKYSNKLWEITHDVFSLSIPMEELGC